MTNVHVIILSIMSGAYPNSIRTYSACGRCSSHYTFDSYRSKEQYLRITDNEQVYAYPKDLNAVTCKECSVMLDALLNKGAIKFQNAKFLGCRILFSGKYSKNRIKTLKDALTEAGLELQRVGPTFHRFRSAEDLAKLPETEQLANEKIYTYDNEDDYDGYDEGSYD